MQPRQGSNGTFSSLSLRLLARRQIAVILLCMAVAQQAVRAQVLHLSNPLNVDRGEEIIELPIKQVIDHLHVTADTLPLLAVQNAHTGQSIPTQLYSSQAATEPDTLLLLVKLHARETVNLKFLVGSNVSPQKALVFGRPVPERKDDFAWENEQVAYRMYGPALEATGEITSGIDVWSKRIPNLVVDSFYQRDHQSAIKHNPALSYHKDDGIGLDSYDVGPTRGCGGTGVWDGDKLSVSNNYTKVKILASGPIRFEFEVWYAPWQAAGKTVTETKRITLDAGSHMNRITSTYTFDGDAPLQLAAGVAIHNGAESKVSAQTSTASVWDTPQDPSAGRIATGALALSAQNAQAVEAAHHGLLLFTRHSDEPFTYFAGAGWSKADMPTYQDWIAYLDLFRQQKEHPLKMIWNIK